jgi:septal ring factor EnvC (AmiA/AmiB activator)
MRYLVSLLLCCLAFGAMGQATSNSRAELEKRRKDILEAIKATQEQLELTKKDKNATLSQLRVLQSKLSERQRLIGNINQEISAINQNINASANEVSGLRNNLVQLKIRYAQSVRYAYKNRSSYGMLAFLFSSADFNTAIRRLKYLKKYRDYRKQQAQDIRRTQASIEEKIKQLNEEKSHKDTLLSTEVQQRQVIFKETTEKDRVVRDLKGREKELTTEVVKNQKSMRSLEKTIQQLIQREIEIARKREAEERRKEEERRKDEERKRLAAAAAAEAARNKGVTVATGSGVRNAPNTGGATGAKPGGVKIGPSPNLPAAPAPAPAPAPRPAPRSYNLSLTPEVAALSESFEANRGRLPWPVEKGFIADGFGRKKHPVYNIQLENSGVDIQTAPNASARAVFGGKVSTVINVPGMGQCVMITHGQFFTVYSRLGSVSVHKGDNVSAKQTLGTVGQNDENEYLLHFELWRVSNSDKASAQDPASWIAR